MNYATLKGASYVLVHTPDMVEKNGTTQTTEKIVNPDSDYLKNFNTHLRSYDDVINYAPNQTYIGNLPPKNLKELPQPWINTPYKGTRYGKLGEIMPQHEFYGVMQICDVFELVHLEKEFASNVRNALATEGLFLDDLDKIKEGVTVMWLEEQLKENHAEGLYLNSKLVGCVLRAHEIDLNLTAHTMLENLVVKASGVIALRHLIKTKGINPEDIDYVIECSEEACGDMNQRGGGNFAKAIAESAGCLNATGSDLRGFCAAPTHALITAASHVSSGTFKNVVILAGGATAKLGMNGKSHIGKGLPILEDVLGAFAVLVGENDGLHPVLRSDLVGRHTVSSGSNPQAVTTALVARPLDKAGYTVHDIDAYSVEMQNPDITKPAGAGDVPEANLKMIAAIGVLRKELEKKELMNFVKEKSLPGWAPTQGHIPSGVPYLGYALDDLMTGDKTRAMIVGKGSLFLGRMTNLFDGVSIIIERNDGKFIEDNRPDMKEEVKSVVADTLRQFAESLTNK
ncbi:glycine/sarcosine/betaine reductase complex component C subunit beta [Vagococcus intermedius]|uniref:Glycine/sarcosine/betaine reductase complex component C subunit beta n=1 Tax=Vagococcus intermedius TaxID=2991418 RepID=A0AAF0CW21_9ENTE|nr:glycine/sarcosine/betaine reductase complex component C subunit beta [Vagococcus intermedius]WEG74080.1 glycine/sarcosine/betaine reductase complex component C subunit beta [Vagococcus intermedius]WEG76160.1 glycine/sarcosine/betaine reductase complex component C subunit beta [Vagococcus intermedius]